MGNTDTSPSHAETERYKAILDAAEKLFVEKGYHAVSIEQIAGDAGVSKGLVHYHFNSKEQLLVCILEDILDILFARLDAIAKRDEPAQIKLRMAIRAYLKLANARSGLARVTFFEEVLTGKAKEHLAELAGENEHKLFGLIEDGISKGEFRAVSSQLVSSLITGTIIEVVREIVMQQRELNEDELADEIADILCNGINS